mmetsp:Transcript_8404/g.30981  ORF Transcript_8404/g.30981 Transcript_8404/m.30981 type:complete len:454 (-) Transcript_8404:72-1433(-)
MGVVVESQQQGRQQARDGDVAAAQDGEGVGQAAIAIAAAAAAQVRRRVDQLVGRQREQVGGGHGHHHAVGAAAAAGRRRVGEPAQARQGGGQQRREDEQRVVQHEPDEQRRARAEAAHQEQLQRLREQRHRHEVAERPPQRRGGGAGPDPHARRRERQRREVRRRPREAHAPASSSAVAGARADEPLGQLDPPPRAADAEGVGEHAQRGAGEGGQAGEADEAEVVHQQRLHVHELRHDQPVHEQQRRRRHQRRRQRLPEGQPLRGGGAREAAARGADVLRRQAQEQEPHVRLVLAPVQRQHQAQRQRRHDAQIGELQGPARGEQIFVRPVVAVAAVAVFVAAVVARGGGNGLCGGGRARSPRGAACPWRCRRMRRPARGRRRRVAPPRPRAARGRGSLARYSAGSSPQRRRSAAGGDGASARTPPRTLRARMPPVKHSTRSGGAPQHGEKHRP